MRMTAIHVVLLGSVVLAALPASAYSRGRFNQSGKTSEGSCLACHGARQYDGMKLRLEGVETASCSVEIAGRTQELTFPKIMYGQRVEAYIEIPTPEGADVPVCPTNNCCDASAAPDPGDEADYACVARGIQLGYTECSASDFLGCCEPDLALCRAPEGLSVATAGFNAEVVNGGRFDTLVRDCGTDRVCPGEPGYNEPDADGTEGDGTLDTSDQTKLWGEVEGGTVDPRQATHTRARHFVDGQAAWKMFYVAPEAEETEGPPRIYVGANVANGNGQADPMDLNSNYAIDVVLTDGTDDLYPDYCLVCSDGSLAVDGACCTCVSAAPSAGTWGFLSACSLLGFLLLGRRRPRAAGRPSSTP